MARRALFSAVVVVACLLTASPVSAQSASWLEWWYRIFSADIVPEPPRPAVVDNDPIQRCEILLQQQNQVHESPTNLVLLALMAAGRRDEAPGDEDHEKRAIRFLDRAIQMDPNSPLLHTMKGQVLLQAGDRESLERAVESHRRALELSRAAQAAGLIVNSRLDLAVVYARLDRQAQAMEEAGTADREAAMLRGNEGALAALQISGVFSYLNKQQEALRAAQRGLDLPEVDSDLRRELLLRQAATYSTLKQWDDAVKSVDRAAEHLPRSGELRVDAELELTRGYLAIASNSDQQQVKEAAARRAKALLDSTANDPANMAPETKARFEARINAARAGALQLLQDPEMAKFEKEAMQGFLIRQRELNSQLPKLVRPRRP